MGIYMPETKNTAVKVGKRSLLRIVFSRTMLITILLLLNLFYLFSICFDLFRFVPLLFGSIVAFTAVMELIVLNSRDDVDFKLSWAVLIAVLPLFGALLYLFVRFDVGNRVNKKLINSSIEKSLPFISTNADLEEQIQAPEPDIHPLTRYLATQAHAPAFQNTEVTYYPLGEEMFADMLADLEKAEKFIFMEYFLVSKGHMWNSILEILKKKASQGVEVRFLYDGMNAFANLPYN
jgi:cardiolipin synthase